MAKKLRDLEINHIKLVNEVNTIKIKLFILKS